MILKVLKQFGFDFSKLPPDVNNAVSLLDKRTTGTFESNNQKLNVLDEAVFKSIKSLFPSNQAVMLTNEIVLKANSKIINDGFNTVFGELSPNKYTIDENFNKHLEDLSEKRMIAVELIFNNWIKARKHNVQLTKDGKRHGK